jgi:hypothetical protein
MYRQQWFKHKQTSKIQVSGVFQERKMGLPRFEPTKSYISTEPDVKSY